MVEGSGRSRDVQTMVEDSGRNRGGRRVVEDPGRSRGDRITMGEFDLNRGGRIMARGPDRNLAVRTTAGASDLNRVDRTMERGPDRNLGGRTMVGDFDLHPAARTMARVPRLIGPRGARDLSRVGLTVGCVRSRAGRTVARDPNRVGRRLVGHGLSLRALTMVRDRRRRGPVVGVRVGRRLPTSRGRLLLIGGPSLRTEATNVLNHSDTQSSAVIRG